ncbi:transmembrane protein 25 [Bufo gargarizans]|uniref:transmembrane protein 25 n=1 Tax=Bufo gargarizans TaxID=30331 RepID=UPI001CF31CE9|nr:transmembrane protein 25 [Bufo gargarizans]XP_044134481.1 transmembrane protein 25 [Bufo gargarizans]
MLLSLSLLLTQQFSHRVLGKPILKDEVHGVSCDASGSSLMWYLNGVKQEAGLGREPPFMLPVAPGSSSSLSLAEVVGEHCNDTRGKDEELLSIHFPPDSPVSRHHLSGLSLILLLVIQSQPPSGFALRDQDGRFFSNSSRFLLLDTRSIDVNGSLRVKVSTKESGISQTSVAGSTWDLLSIRVEIPLLLLIVTGSALIAGILLVNVLVCCLVLKKKRSKYDVGNQLTLSVSNNMKLNNSCLPREHMSLPSNLQLNDLRPQRKGSENSTCATQEDVSAPSGTTTESWFDRFPLVGYIYKASSVSSEEIWL